MKILDTRALLVCMGQQWAKRLYGPMKYYVISYNDMSKITIWKKITLLCSCHGQFFFSFPETLLTPIGGTGLVHGGWGVYGKIQNLKFIIDFLLFTVNCFCIVTATKFGMWYDFGKKFFSNFSCRFPNPNYFSKFELFRSIGSEKPPRAS